MLQHNPPLLSRYKVGPRTWQLGFEVGRSFWPGGNIEEVDLILPNGYCLELVPKQIAFFCESCGELWGRIRFACEQEHNTLMLTWDFVLRECQKCGDGSMRLQSNWHRYGEAINLSIPYNILIRELDIEMNKAEEVLKCQQQTM